MISSLWKMKTRKKNTQTKSAPHSCKAPAPINRVPRILGQRAENGVFRGALQGTVSNHGCQITINSPQNICKPQFVNRVPRILGQRAGKGVARVALQGTVSNHPFQITINSLPDIKRFLTDAVLFGHGHIDNSFALPPFGGILMSLRRVEQ